MVGSLGVGDAEFLRGVSSPRSGLAIVPSPAGPYNDTETEGNSSGRTVPGGHRAGRADDLATQDRPCVYLPVFPVYAVQDDVENHQFIIALDESLRFLGDPLSLTGEQRRYADRVVRERLHQPDFRTKVVRAYSSRCTICSRRRSRRLDATHIVRDRDDWGDPLVPNGLSLCSSTTPPTTNTSSA